MTQDKLEKAAMFLEQTLITDIPPRVVRAAAALAPDHSAVAGRLLAGIEAAARHDRVSSLGHVDEARRLWAVDEAARRLCTAQLGQPPNAGGRHRVSLCIARPGTWPAGVVDYEPAGSGWLTTNHPASSYGQPVLVVEGCVYGPGDAAARGWLVGTHDPEYCAEPELCAAWRAAEAALRELADEVEG